MSSGILTLQVNVLSLMKHINPLAWNINHPVSKNMFVKETRDYDKVFPLATVNNEVYTFTKHPNAGYDNAATLPRPAHRTITWLYLYTQHRI